MCVWARRHRRSFFSQASTQTSHGSQHRQQQCQYSKHPRLDLRRPLVVATAISVALPQTSSTLFPSWLTISSRKGAPLSSTGRATSTVTGIRARRASCTSLSSSSVRSTRRAPTRSQDLRPAPACARPRVCGSPRSRGTPSTAMARLALCRTPSCCRTRITCTMRRWCSS